MEITCPAPNPGVINTIPINSNTLPNNCVKSENKKREKREKRNETETS